MDIRFWGTRGSLAKPGRITLRHGGNTSCVEVRGDDGTLIVLDCGTGAHGLGQALLSAGLRCDGHLMITHTHWDHKAAKFRTALRARARARGSHRE